jgi:hypothetical protein
MVRKVDFGSCFGYGGLWSADGSRRAWKPSLRQNLNFEFLLTSTALRTLYIEFRSILWSHQIVVIAKLTLQALRDYFRLARYSGTSRILEAFPPLNSFAWLGWYPQRDHATCFGRKGSRAQSPRPPVSCCQCLSKDYPGLAPDRLPSPLQRCQ